MTPTDRMEHASRPWWRSCGVWWFGLIAVMGVLAIAMIVMVEAGKLPWTPYSQFLDQLEADNVASVTFRGTEMDVRLRHPLARESLAASGQPNTIISRVPDIGDPMLVAELRRQHVVIDVYAPSVWTSLVARVPWAMVPIHRCDDDRRRHQTAARRPGIAEVHHVQDADIWNDGTDRGLVCEATSRHEITHRR